MSLEITKKEKALAVLVVVLLFLFVGIFSFSVSLINKNRTEILRAKVLQIKKEKENLQALSKLAISTSTLETITAKSYLTMGITDGGTKKVLLQKNSDQKLPIASITKLMVAVIATENLSQDAEIKATLDYIGKEESAFVLETNKTYTVKELLNNMLVSSDNDSARLLSGFLGEDIFIAKMNLKAQALGLTQTNFENVTGLDPNESRGLNTSTVNDLASLLIYIKNYHPSILKITTKPEYNFCDINNYCKVVQSTDKLLGEKSLKFRLLGGKTGTTDLALKNLAVIVKPADGVYIINIVLGSQNNFADTLSLINHVIINN